MIPRRVPPVVTDASLPAILRAFGQGSDASLEQRVADRWRAGSVALTDSGTSALVAAFRLAATNGTVALPAYGCVDLVAAAIRAGVRVRLYDLDPATLAPDLDSVARVLKRGVDAVVVTHILGYPADVDAVARLATPRGATVIEDAAQGASGRLRGRLAGSLGALSVLSFGRGKGVGGGGGGALLSRDERFDGAVRALAESFATPRRGAASLVSTLAQWGLGHPATYALPSALPFLRLGEMVYHPAHDPVAMPLAARALLSASLVGLDAARERRARVALRLDAATRRGTVGRVVRTLPGAEPGYLRLPMLGVAVPDSASALGVVRMYPATVPEMREAGAVLLPGENDCAGAAVLRDRLRTLPTHRRLGERDLRALETLLSGTPVPSPPGVTAPRIAARRERSVTR